MVENAMGMTVSIVVLCFGIFMLYMLGNLFSPMAITQANAKYFQNATGCYLNDGLGTSAGSDLLLQTTDPCTVNTSTITLLPLLVPLAAVILIIGGLFGLVYSIYKSMTD